MKIILLCTSTIIMQLSVDQALSQALRPWIYRQVVEAKAAANILACTMVVVMRRMKVINQVDDSVIVSLTMPISLKRKVLI